MHKSLVLLPFLLASALAGEIIAHAAEPLPQYNHEQNTATGEYGYSYSGGPSAKTEYRALDGTTTGAYSYIDAHGILQSVNYIADEFGFRAAGTNIPSEGSVPLDAPDVAAVKAAHLAEHSRATLSALQHRKKRGILALAAPAHLPIATSSQSRVQIHKSAHLLAHQPVAIAAAAPLASHALLFRKKRGIYAAAEAPLAYAAPVYQHLPISASSQNRFQIHNSARLVQEYHQPIYAAAPVLETRAALPLAAPVAAPVYQHLPISTSSQNRYQIHNGAKIIQEYHQPLYAAAAAPIAAAPIAAAPIAAAPVAPAGPPAYLPPRDYYPAEPLQEAIAPAGPAASGGETAFSDDAISVESA